MMLFTNARILGAIAVVTTCVSTACEDYASYTRDDDSRRDAASSSGGAAHGETGAGGGTMWSGDTGGVALGTSNGGVGPEHRDAGGQGRPESGTGRGALLPDASGDTAHPDGSIGELDAGVALRDASRDGGHSGTDSFRDEVTFEEQSDYYLFDYHTPIPFSEGPGEWVWALTRPGQSGALVQTTNVAGSTHNYSGTFAIYEPRSAGNVAVSVTLSSPDKDAGGVFIGYEDEWSNYRFFVNSQGWGLWRGQTWDLTTDLAGGSLCDALPTICGEVDLKIPRRIALEARGSTLRGWVNGVLVVTAEAPAYRGGKVGLFTRALANAHFDDLRIESTMSPRDSDAGSSN